MASYAARRARAGRALAVMTLLLSVACGGDDDSPRSASNGTVPTTVARSSDSTPAPARTVLAVTVRGGSVVEGGSRQRATVNEAVTIRVTSDVEDEGHVHGYEKKFNVAAGQTGEVTFNANIPGVFEVEFERSHKQLLTMEVR